MSVDGRKHPEIGADSDNPFDSNFSGSRHRTPVLLQTEAAECGLACVAMICCHFGAEVSLASLRGRYSTSLRGVSLDDLIQNFGELGLIARAVRVEIEDFDALQLPCVLHWNFNHFVVLTKVNQHHVDVHDPARGFQRISLASLSEQFTGVALEVLPGLRFGLTPKIPLTNGFRLAAIAKEVRGLTKSGMQILVIALILQIVTLFAPFFMQWAVDHVVPTNDRLLLTGMALGFAILLVLQTSLSTMRSWMVTYLGAQLNIALSVSVVDHLLRLPIQYFERRNIGDITSRIGGVQTINKTLSSGFVEAILDGAMALITIAVMLFYSITLTTIAVLALAAYTLLRFAIYKPLRSANEAQIVSGARQETHLLESIRGVQSLRLFGRESARMSAFKNLVVETSNNTARTQQYLIWYTAADTLIFGTAALATTYFGIAMVLEGSISLGMLFAFTSYFLSFTLRGGGLIDKYMDLRMLSLQLERLSDVMSHPCEEPAYLNDGGKLANAMNDKNAAHDQHVVLTMNSVSFRYSISDSWILSGCSLAVGNGECVAIVGASGAGKTTLLKLLLGIHETTTGSVAYRGENIRSLGLATYRKRIGTVMQDDRLFAGSISDNIHFFDNAPNFERVRECARLACVLDDVLAMPMAFESLVGDMGSSLSGGQKQRILLARALYKQPDILVLDEATSHLDMTNEKAVNSLIVGLDITRIIVAHRAETIAAADRVLRLSGGRLYPER